MANTPPPLPDDDPPTGGPAALPPPGGAPGGGQPVDPQTFFWLFFRPDGRVGRQVYWLTFFFLVALVGATQPFLIDPETQSIAWQFGPLQSFVYTASTVCSIIVSIKRLHDLGLSGFIALGLIIPFIGVVLTLWLGVRKGDDGPNAYGERADVRPPGPLGGTSGRPD
ncbi:MAG: DUF805 domain-containing protein [Pseudomonadota bacterium]